MPRSRPPSGAPDLLHTSYPPNIYLSLVFSVFLLTYKDARVVFGGTKRPLATLRDNIDGCLQLGEVGAKTVSELRKRGDKLK